MRQQDLWLGRKQQSLIKDTPIQRLLTKAIARDEKLSPSVIPQREREHAVELRDHVPAVFFVKMRQNFGVRSAAKGVATRFQVRAQFAIVVDFAVENHGDAFVFVVDRLLARDEIDDRQPPHPESYAVADYITFRVRPAMNHAVAHRVQELFRAVRRRRARIKIGPAGYAAHKTNLTTEDTEEDHNSKLRQQIS